MAPTTLLGRLEVRRELDAANLEGYLVVARVGDRQLAETRTDGNGTFLLLLDPRDVPFVDLEVHAAAGGALWHGRLSRAEIQLGEPLKIPVDVTAAEALLKPSPDPIQRLAGR